MVAVVELFKKAKDKEQLFNVEKLKLATGLGNTVTICDEEEGQFKLLMIFRFNV